MSSQSNVIEFECPHCAAKLKAKAKGRGKRVKCSSCGEPLTIPDQLTELDTVFEAGEKAASSEKPALNDIDFSFTEDIDEMLKRANEEQEKAKLKKAVEAPPIVGSAAEKVQESVQKPPKVERAKPKPAPVQPPRPQIVVPNHFLPEKQRIQKQIKEKQKQKRQELVGQDLEPPTKANEKPVDDFGTPGESPELTLNDDDILGEDLLSQVDSIDVELDGEGSMVHSTVSADDDSPIKIEGLTKGGDVNEIYGLKCGVCDTRIHVTAEQVGQLVECPECFSKVKVTPAVRKSNLPDWMGTQPGFSNGDSSKPKSENADPPETRTPEPSEPVKPPPAKGGFKESNPERQFNFDLEEELQFAPEPEPSAEEAAANSRKEVPSPASSSSSADELEEELQLRPELAADEVETAPVVKASMDELKLQPFDDGAADMNDPVSEERETNSLPEESTESAPSDLDDLIPKNAEIEEVAEVGLPPIEDDLLQPIQRTEASVQRSGERERVGFDDGSDGVDEGDDLKLAPELDSPENQPNPSTESANADEGRSSIGFELEDELDIEPVADPLLPDPLSLELSEEDLTPEPEPADAVKPRPAAVVPKTADAVSKLASSEKGTVKPKDKAKIRRVEKSRKKTSRREKFEQAEDEENEELAPVSVHEEEDLEPLSFASLGALIKTVVTNPGVMWRAAASVLLLTAGVFFLHQYRGTIGEDAEKGFMGAMSFIFYLGMYLSIYGMGTAFLWYLCSFIFRDTARGLKNVSFKTAGFDEVKSTFLLFAFSFMVAGSPFLMLDAWVSAPFRMLIAPFLLILAWFNQNPFIGLGFEPLKTFGSEGHDWRHMFIFIMGCAFASVIGGLLYNVPYCGLFGAVIMVAATIVFAAVTGWHSGRIIKKLEKGQLET